MACNFGMPGPEGYRKALRLMKQAEKFGRPIITFIDTPGAYPGKDAEERGQGEAIARNLMEMSGLTVPVIAVVTGEGSSGGALALGVANHILMLENAVYSVLSPEGFASILWKDSSRSGEACELMKLTAQDLYRDGIVEEVIPEPVGGAQRSHTALFAALDTALWNHLRALNRMNGRQLADQRYKKIPSDRGNEESMNGFELIATGGALPGRNVTNDDLSRMVDTSDEWITTRTGIRTRHWCAEGETAATLAIAAARQALARSGLSPADIGCCVCATLSAPDATPQRSLSGTGCPGPAGEHPGTGRQRRLLRLRLRHRRGPGPAGNAGRPLRPGHRLRGALPPDGSCRPLHLRPLRGWGRSGGLCPVRHPLCHHAGGPGQRCHPCRRPRPERLCPPSPWTARPCSALRWTPCPGACTRCWTRRS